MSVNVKVTVPPGSSGMRSIVCIRLPRGHAPTAPRDQPQRDPRPARLARAARVRVGRGGSLRQAEEEPGGRAIQGGCTTVALRWARDDPRRGRRPRLHRAVPLEAPDRRASAAARLRKAALDLVAGYFRGRPVSKPCGRARARARAARSLYERYGFEQT